MNRKLGAEFHGQRRNTIGSPLVFVFVLVDFDVAGEPFAMIVSKLADLSAARTPFDILFARARDPNRLPTAVRTRVRGRRVVVRHGRRSARPVA
jgi:hypothetical protein